MSVVRSGLVGRAILASRSPWLHEQEARALGIALRYELFDFDERGLSDGDLGPLVAELAARGFSGFNVTYPFKQAIMPLLDGLGESAEQVGAVNTVAIRGGRLTGHNTDMAGFRENLLAGLGDARRDQVVQLGAGGAGAAVAAALLSSGTRRLTISDLVFARARSLAARLAAMWPDAEIVARAGSDLATPLADGIVNATPMGMVASPGLPLDPDLIEPRHWVADIVYFPLETELLRTARAKGCCTLDGSGMVVRQAALAFEIITGIRADTARMQRSFAG